MAKKNTTPNSPKNGKTVVTKLGNNPEAQKTVLALDPTAVIPEPSPEETSGAQPENPNPNPEQQGSPEQPKTEEKPKESAKKTKTQGIFQITSKYDPTVVLKGSSSQIEICTRDYMNWCLKDKAPKALQAEYNRVHVLYPTLVPADIFTVTVLQACPTVTDLKDAKAKFGLLPSSKSAETPAEPKKPSKLMIFAQISANAKFIREMLENGDISPEDKDNWVLVENFLNSAENTLKPMNLAVTPATPEKPAE